MKKILTLCLLTVSTAAFAQLPINIGLKGGVNYSLHQETAFMQNIPNSGSVDGGTSYVGGAFVRLKIKKFTGQVEGLLVGVNGSTSGFLASNDPANPLPTNINGDIRFTNLDIPVLVGYRFLELGPVKLGANVGATFSTPILKGGDLPEDNYEYFNYTSLTAGISVDIPLFLFDLRYQNASAFDQIYHSFGSADMISITAAWKIL